MDSPCRSNEWMSVLKSAEESGEKYTGSIRVGRCFRNCLLMIASTSDASSGCNYYDNPRRRSFSCVPSSRTLRLLQFGKHYLSLIRCKKTMISSFFSIIFVYLTYMHRYYDKNENAISQLANTGQLNALQSSPDIKPSPQSDAYT